MLHQKTLLVWGHSSHKQGGGEQDITNTLKFLSTNIPDIKLIGAFPEGPRFDVNLSYCNKAQCHRGALFPVIYESIKNYIAYFIFATKQINQIKQFIKQQKPDAILFFSSAQVMPFIWSLTFKTKRYLFVRELISPNWIRKLLFKFIFNKSNIVFSVSSFLKDELQQQNFKPVIHTIYSIPDVSFVKKTKPKQRNDKFGIACVGGISKIKGQLKLLQACQLINSSENIELNFFGKIPTHSTGVRYYNEILQFQQNNNLKTKVTFHGVMDYKVLLSRLTKIDLIAIPSDTEGLSLVLLEAIQLGIPVIASNIGEIKRIIKHGENGLLFESTSIQSIAESINTMRNQDITYKTIISNLGKLPKYLGTNDSNLSKLVQVIRNDLK